MPDFEKIKQNQQLPEVTAKFLALYKDQSTYLSGWIALDITLSQFASTIIEEINYSWDLGNQNMDDYAIFHIDTEDKNKLREIKKEQTYQAVRKSKTIYLVILHKDIRFHIIENLPLVYDWLSENI